MTHKKIEGTIAAIGGMAGRVSEDVWAELKCIRAELIDAAAQAEALENHIAAPGLAVLGLLKDETQEATAHG
jgi:hypothetical protein